MSTEQHTITVSGLEVQIDRKAIKNLHLGVYPPDGHVRIAAPPAISDAALRVAVIERLSWIKRHRAAFARQPREAEREMVTGESHYYRGRRYRLDVVEAYGRPAVELRGRRIVLHVDPAWDADQRGRLLQRWYRAHLREAASPLIETWAAKLGVSVRGWGIKKMKTKWGSCNATARRIWINLELAKKPPACLEYVVVHELAHLVARHHDARFLNLMDRYLPNWPHHRAQLNASLLPTERKRA